MARFQRKDIQGIVDKEITMPASWNKGQPVQQGHLPCNVKVIQQPYSMQHAKYGKIFAFEVVFQDVELSFGIRAPFNPRYACHEVEILLVIQQLFCLTRN